MKIIEVQRGATPGISFVTVDLVTVGEGDKVTDGSGTWTVNGVDAPPPYSPRTMCLEGEGAPDVGETLAEAPRAT